MCNCGYRGRARVDACFAVMARGRCCMLCRRRGRLDHCSSTGCMNMSSLCPRGASPQLSSCAASCVPSCRTSVTARKRRHLLSPVSATRCAPPAARVARRVVPTSSCHSGPATVARVGNDGESYPDSIRPSGGAGGRHRVAEQLREDVAEHRDAVSCGQDAHGACVWYIDRIF